jgi:uncharacterized protein YgiM (DUF1202 family)
MGEFESLQGRWMSNTDRLRAVSCFPRPSRHHAGSASANPQDYNYRVWKATHAAAIVAMIATGCTAGPSGAAGTPTPFFATATLESTLTPKPTAAPGTATPSPTGVPRLGMTSTQLYIRGEPSSASPPLSLIGPATQVQIFGKDASGSWYQIVYAQGQGGRAWVSSQYVVVEDKSSIPIISGAADTGPSGAITEQVNVRSGPSSDSSSLGTLNPKDVVSITGKSGDSSWVQIKYDGGPDGKGWVAASYLQATGLEGVPIIAAGGGVLGTSTSTVLPATPMPTVVAARQDGDSEASPSVNIPFSPSGVGSFIYSDEVSAPQGDAQDWIGFTQYQAKVFVRLTCTGNGRISTELLQNGEIIEKWDSLSCGGATFASLEPGQPYLLQLSAVSNGAGLQYVRYTLSVDGAP